LLEPTLQSIPIKRPKPRARQLQGLCLDRDYDSPPTHNLAVQHGYTPHIRARGEEIKLKRARPAGAHGAGSSKPVSRNRGILTRWSKKDENHLARLQLASSLTAFMKAHLAATQPGRP
jgi:putative transposase